MQVWVVEDGVYSDRCVVAVCSMSDEADRLATRLKDPSITVFEVDLESTAIARGWPGWRGQMLRDGSTDILDMDAEVVARYAYLVGWPGQVRLCFGCLAPDANGAAKIANEYRARFIASGEWDAREEP